MVQYTSRPNQNGTYNRLHQSDGRGYGKKARPGGVDYDRLFEAMRFSRRVLMRFRQERQDAVREFVGGHYSDAGAGVKVPLNLLARYIQITARSLVPKCPKVMYSTRKLESLPAVGLMQDWVNDWLQDTYFAKTAQRCVIDSLFCLGIMKVALGTPADAAASGYVGKAGVPFAECVDLDDFVFDAGCRDFRQASFVGHRYRVPREVAESLDYFDKKARKDLSGAATPEGYVTNQEGDERIDVIGRSYMGGSTRDFEELVDLWEVYCLRSRKVLTFASDRGGVPSCADEPLRVQEWLGPECGPYHFLAMMPVPGNAMPKGAVMDLIDLHQFVNHGYRKLVNQMQRQKSVLPVRGGQVDDGNNLVQASDGEMFSCDNADTIKEVSYGGPSQVNALFTTHLADQFNKMAGNLDLQAGAAPQSKTASQDKLLNENAGAGVADMQETTVAFLASVLRSVGWFWWNHPQQVMTQAKTLPGLADIGITRTLHPAGATNPDGSEQPLQRSGRFEDLRVRVDPYSLVYRSPQQRGQFLLTLFDKFAPAQQMFEAQNVKMDLQLLVKKIAEYWDEPDVEQLFTIADTQPRPKRGGDGGGMGMPANTSREYTRQSVGRDTAASRYADMANGGTAEASDQQEG